MSAPKVWVGASVSLTDLAPTQWVDLSTVELYLLHCWQATSTTARARYFPVGLFNLTDFQMVVDRGQPAPPSAKRQELFRRIHENLVSNPNKL